MSNLISSDKKRLGDVLLEKGILSQDQLDIALIEQKKFPQPLGKLLVQLGFVAESLLRHALGELFEQQSVDLETLLPDVEALHRVAKSLAQRHSLIPTQFNASTKQLSVAMADPHDLIALDRIRAQQAEPLEIITLLAGEGEIKRAIDRFYGHELSINGILAEIEQRQRSDKTPAEEDYRNPMVRLVDAILVDAVKRDASDVHFEPERGFLRIRYRIDGVLRQIRSLHEQFWSAMVVRLKVMAKLNIAESRAPQDGRFSLSIRGHAIDFRVSTVRTLHGENIVLRILDRHKGVVELAELGLEQNNFARLQLMMRRPEGLILVTGPTGSGKTSTLYSMLQQLNHDTVNIMTLEDPVEYPTSLLRQISLNEAVKLDFANGIRTLMRQDPDLILVGEIRDHETAVMALRAAMTGHQVYSTLHTNSALAVVARLVDLGVSSEILAGNLIGVVAQRLLRCLCPECKQAYQPLAAEMELLRRDDFSGAVFKAVGCAACDYQGYRGRFAIMEVLRMDADLDELIVQAASQRKMLALLLEKGFCSLRQDGLRQVRAGQTSLHELARVVDLEAGY
ncbi:MAG: ATPase, T2SS/T4P/T4SS family [Gammaproteobacteria bacterium]|nr:ATPase, T2SS/T4P/T4SS family [Gammaproteobacteria bacterium]